VSVKMPYSSRGRSSRKMAPRIAITPSALGQDTA
jgi:hypothetical protein